MAPGSISRKTRGWISNMARVTAESLMAPGGLLDAGSRLTQTLINVPFQREQFRAGLDEKALLLKREDDQRSKNDKVGYLKDRIATVQQQIATLRRSLDIGDKTEAEIALKSLNKNGLGATSPALSKNASEAVNKALEQATSYEVDQRKQLITKLGEGFSSKDEQGIADRTAAVRDKALAEVRKQYPGEPWDVSSGMSLKGIDLDKIRSDPQLKQELDAALDQQTKLFDQYRQLVGQADDTVDAHSFLQRTMPDVAPGKPAAPALGPPGTNPGDYQNMPASQPPPMATLPGGGTRDAMVAAAQRLDDPSVIQNLAQNANPMQQDQLAQQQLQSAPQLNQQMQTLNDAVQQGQNAGMQPQEMSKIQGVLDQKRQARAAILHHALSHAAFGQATPETLNASAQLLATVAPAGQDMLFNEIVGDQEAAKNNADPSIGANGYTPTDSYTGPRITPQLVPRLQALAPPGILPAQVAAQQQQQQRDIRSRLSAQGLYPR